MPAAERPRKHARLVEDAPVNKGRTKHSEVVEQAPEDESSPQHDQEEEEQDQETRMANYEEAASKLQGRKIELRYESGTGKGWYKCDVLEVNAEGFLKVQFKDHSIEENVNLKEWEWKLPKPKSRKRKIPTTERPKKHACLDAGTKTFGNPQGPSSGRRNGNVYPHPTHKGLFVARGWFKNRRAQRKQVHLGQGSDLECQLLVDQWLLGEQEGEGQGLSAANDEGHREDGGEDNTTREPGTWFTDLANNTTYICFPDETPIQIARKFEIPVECLLWVQTVSKYIYSQLLP